MRCSCYIYVRRGITKVLITTVVVHLEDEPCVPDPGALACLRGGLEVTRLGLSPPLPLGLKVERGGGG